MLPLLLFGLQFLWSLGSCVIIRYIFLAVQSRNGLQQRESSESPKKKDDTENRPMGNRIFFVKKQSIFCIRV